jgi:low temperature requirement protein LtrA
VVRRSPLRFRTPVRRQLHAPDDQAVTFVELFFDLVFVFAITEITKLTASHLTGHGVARSLLLFWLIWWAWTQFTWTLNPADTNQDLVRIVTLVATAVAFVMASSVTRAFGPQVLWFVVPYLLVRLLGLALQVRVDLEHDSRDQGSVLPWVARSLIGLALVLTGACFDTPARNWIWLAAVAADLFAALTSARGGRTWDIHPAHFSERHGLFVIIALGESLIVAATAISGADRTAALMGDVVAALVVVCLLWWTYFGWLKEAVERGLASAPATHVAALARDAFSLGHFPLVCGIIAFSVAVQEIVQHPATPTSGEVVGALGTGIALFVGSSAFVYWRTCGHLLVARLAILVVTEVALLLLADQDPVWLLGSAAVGTLAIVVVEAMTHRETTAERELERDIPPADR